MLLEELPDGLDDLRSRPMNELCGTWTTDPRIDCAAPISFARLSTPSLRRSDAMWLSTVRTEMWNSSAISRLLSRLPTAARTAVSWRVSS